MWVPGFGKRVARFMSFANNSREEEAAVHQSPDTVKHYLYCYLSVSDGRPHSVPKGCH